MDVSDIIASNAAQQKVTTVDKEIPLLVDAGFLTVTDLNPTDKDSYDHNIEDHLITTARDGVQALISTLTTLPTTSSPYGTLTLLPAPTTPLPRSKPLPKAKPPTKWELFAKKKGIQKKTKDKKVWDEEKQEWVERWGRNGKNKEGEEAWATEVPMGADVDNNPAHDLRAARKSRVAKNDRQQLQNQARAQAQIPERDRRKMEIEKTLATTRISTASMGRFDKKLEGEKKLRGVKRKFEPAESSVEKEKNASLAIISRLEHDTKRSRNDSAGDETLNVRKAIRTASRGRGSAALARGTSERGRGRGAGGRGGGGRGGGRGGDRGGGRGGRGKR